MCHICNISCNHAVLKQKAEYWDGVVTTNSPELCPQCSMREDDTDPATCSRRAFENRLDDIKAGKYSDVTIMSMPDNVEFHAHMILLSKSSWFDKAFNGGFKEATDKKVELTETATQIEKLLAFVYTKDYINLTRHYANNATEEACLHVEMYQLGDKYDFPQLFAEAGAALLADITAYAVLKDPSQAAYPPEFDHSTVAVFRDHTGLADLGQVAWAIRQTEIGRPSFENVREAMMGFLHRNIFQLARYPGFAVFLRETDGIGDDLLVRLVTNPTPREADSQCGCDHDEFCTSAKVPSLGLVCESLMKSKYPTMNLGSNKQFY